MVSTGTGEQKDASIGRAEGAGRRWTWWDAVFALAALVVAVLRFLILRRGGAPATIDAGNWLAFADGMLGDSVRSSSIVYPPVVPLLTKASVAAFGLTGGVAVMGAVSSLAPGVGMYVALRAVAPAGGAAAAGLLVLGASSVGEATAWGGFPQLIGLGLTPIALILFDRLQRTWSTRHALGSGLVLMVVLATSHLIGAVAVLACGTMAVAGLVRPLGPIPNGWRRTRQLGLVALPSMWLAPLYWSLVGVYRGGFSPAGSSNRLTWSNLFDRVEFLYRDTPWLWRIVLPLAVAAPFILWRRRHTPLWRVTSALLVITIVLVAATREDRLLYLLTPLGALGLVLWTDAAEPGGAGRHPAGRLTGRARPFAWVGVAILVVGLGFQFVRSTEFFGSQREHYGILTPGLVDGIRYLGESSAPDDTVAVTSLNNAPLGWWVEAIARRPTIYGSPLQWLSFDDEIERAAFANELFVPPFPTTDRLQAAETAGIELILVPTAWTFYDDGAIDSLAEMAPDVVQRVSPDAVVIRPGALGP